MFLWDFYIVRLDSSSYVYTKTDDLSDGSSVFSINGTIMITSKGITFTGVKRS